MFSLPILSTCGNASVFAMGALICTQPTQNASVKIKVPPTDGQFRAVDCQKDLTEDGTPDDFNFEKFRKGFWLWRKTLVKISETPSFSFSNPRNNCPVIVSVASRDTGTQQAAIFFQSNLSLDFQYECNGVTKESYLTDPNRVGSFAGYCRSFVGTEHKVRVKPFNQRWVLNAVGPSCNFLFKASWDITGAKPEFTVPVKDGFCPISFELKELVNEKIQIKKGFFVSEGQPSSYKPIDSANFVKDDGQIKIIPPMFANLMWANAITSGQVVWQGDKNNGVIEVSSDRFLMNTKLCAASYSNELGSESFECVDPQSMKRVPYEFR